MISLLLALQVSGAAAPRAQPDSESVVAALRTEVASFLLKWRDNWEKSEESRHPVASRFLVPIEQRRVTDVVTADRLDHLHCHVDDGDPIVAAQQALRRFNSLGKAGASANTAFAPLPNLIAEGRPSKRALCPQWSPLDAASPDMYDERRSIDTALIARLRAPTRAERAKALEHLAAGARHLPGDSWIAGQRVRLAIDQGDTASAFTAVAECAADISWCAALSGWVSYAVGHAADADSAFSVALAAMTPEDRCEFTDISVLLEDAARARYNALPCGARDSVTARFWWLADPLYSERGNERRAEHMFRQLTIVLHRVVVPSERWDWTVGSGGRSLAELITRYGWPSQAWWFGHNEDWSHSDGYIKVHDTDTADPDVFTTVEYSLGRYHVAPDWSAVLDPWHATASAWTLAAPEDRPGHADRQWWPREHYARDAGSLIQIPEQQTGMLRRRDAIELAVAADLSRVNLPGAQRGRGTLIVSPEPDVLRLASMTVALDSTAVWRAFIAPQPAVVGLEVRATGAQAATARTRFGIVPAATLATFTRGAIDLSEPILVRAPDGNDEPATDPSDALARMLGTTRLRSPTRIGVYWETYGIAPAETLDVAVRIERTSEPGAMRRIGSALHLADRGDGGVTLSWREPRNGLSATVFDGDVPIQSRNISVDVSSLEPATYSLTITVTRPTGQTAAKSRAFEIVSR